MQSLGKKIENKINAKGSGSVSKAFITASLLFCVGSMAIIGALESGIHGNHQILFAKSLIDGVTAVILAVTYGIGVLLSSLSVLVYQGIITILSNFIGPYLTDDMLRELSIVGGILIFGLGLDVLGIKKIKAGNFLPLFWFRFYIILLSDDTLSKT